MEYEDYGDENYDQDFYEEEEADNMDLDVEGLDDCSTSKGAEKSYTVLSENAIQQRQTTEVTHVASLFSISPPFATALLCHYKWNTTKVYDEWFADEVKVRRTVGILPISSDHENGKDSSSETRTCQICFDDFAFEETFTAGCSHPYCSSCWQSYIASEIESGSRVLSLRCPEPKCPRAVTYDMIDKFSLEEDRKKYFSYVRRSYVEGRGEKIKWCPAPDCENAVEFERGGCEWYDVVCPCTNEFCWNCVEEIHRPLDCETVGEWILKNSSEAENTQYILAFTKPCPKCKRPIEKNNGCNHMSCRCGCHFCWFCLRTFAEKHYSCNKYSMENAGEGIKRLEETRKQAKTQLMRYVHYFERWATNEKSMKQAKEDLQNAKNVVVKSLSELFDIPETELGFIVEAWKRIVDCRRVIMWSYAYGYYLPVDEFAKKNVFEYMQNQAESPLEKLHRCVETELKEIHTKAQFLKLKEKLNDLIVVTGKHFDNFVKALNNGLSDVGSVPPPQKPKKNRGSTSTQSILQSEGFSIIEDGDHGEQFWRCDRCTFLNRESVVQCEVCFDAY